MPQVWREIFDPWNYAVGSGIPQPLAALESINLSMLINLILYEFPGVL
jgi:hypothetical protein